MEGRAYIDARDSAMEARTQAQSEIRLLRTQGEALDAVTPREGLYPRTNPQALSEQGITVVARSERFGRRFGSDVLLYNDIYNFDGHTVLVSRHGVDSYSARFYPQNSPRIGEAQKGFRQALSLLAKQVAGEKK